MLITIPDILNPERVRHARRLLEESQWVDESRVTAGRQSARTKDNMQLPGEPPRLLKNSAM